MLKRATTLLVLFFLSRVAFAGEFSPNVYVTDGATGTTYAAVKAASTAPVATDPALVVAVSPNGQPVATSVTDVVPATQNVTAQDVATVSLTGANGQVFYTGTPTVNSAATFTLSSMRTVNVQAGLIGGGGTMVVEISDDGGTFWFRPDTYQHGTQVYTNSFTAPFSVTLNVTTMTNVRVRAISSWSGTATIAVRESLNTRSVTIGNSLPPGGNVIGGVTANVTQFGGVNLSTGTGVSGTGIPRVTVANDSNILATQSGTWLNRITDGITTATVFPSGELRVAREAVQEFLDTYDTGLDTALKWTASSAGGGVAPISEVADTRLGTGTTANGYSRLVSQMTFSNSSPGFLNLRNNVNLPNPISNSEMYWGFGTAPATPTATAPVTEGCGFEVQTTGKMFAVCYATGSRNVIQDLSAATGNGKQPTDTATHKYDMYYRGDLAYFLIDDGLVGTMATGAPGPNVNTLPILMLAIAGATPPVTNQQLQSNAVWVADTSGSFGTRISDGTSPWFKLKINSDGSINIAPLTITTLINANAIPVDGTKQSFSASVTGLVPVATATDVFTLTGSGTKVVRVTRVEISGSTGAVTGVSVNTVLIKRSAANTGGTSSALTAVPHDSTNSAATATALSYTANPTGLGASVGTVRAQRLFYPVNGNLGASAVWDFGIRPSQDVVLRGTAQVLAVNLSSTTITTGALDINIEWTEE